MLRDNTVTDVAIHPVIFSLCVNIQTSFPKNHIINIYFVKLFVTNSSV